MMQLIARFTRMSAIAIVLVMSLAAFSRVAASEFSADLTETKGDEVSTGKIYVKGEKYRMDATHGDDQYIVIVDPTINKTLVALASSKEYRELPTDHGLSRMNDPFQAYRYMIDMGEERSAGEETVAGMVCDKYVISMMDTDVMSKWVARDLGFPIKIVAAGPPEQVMELTEIETGPVDDALFVMPADFKKWIDPESLPIEPPEWAGGIEAAPVLAPPFERTMATGEMVRIKPELAKSLAVKAVSTTEAEAEAKVIPFKDGRPVKRENRINNIAMKGVICGRSHESPVEVDEFVVYVYSGEITLQAKWTEMAEQTVSAGEEMRFAIQGSDNIETRMINLADGESVAVFDYVEGGTVMDEEQAGPVKWRTITLKEPMEIKAVPRVAKGDEIVFRVTSGKMQIKLGQFDSFEF